METNPQLLVVLGAAAVLLLLGLGLVLLLRRKRVSTAHNREAQLKAAVASKAAAAEEQKRQKEEEQANLTESGVLAIHQLVRQLAADGDLEGAEKWALQALDSDPRRIEVAVQLAEIYHGMGRRKAFFATLDRHVISRRDELRPDQQARIERMVAELSALPADPRED